MIDYTTGDSFGSERREDDVAAIWSSEKTVKKALQDIYEHNEYCRKYKQRNLTPEQRKEINKEVSTKDWYYSARDYYRDDIEYRKDFDFMPNDPKLVTWLENLRDGVIEDLNNNQWNYSMYITLDEGVKFKIDVFWQGHFEEFFSAKIIEIK